MFSGTALFSETAGNKNISPGRINLYSWKTLWEWDCVAWTSERAEKGHIILKISCWWPVKSFTGHRRFQLQINGSTLQWIYKINKTTTCVYYKWGKFYLILGKLGPRCHASWLQQKKKTHYTSLHCAFLLFCSILLCSGYFFLALRVFCLYWYLGQATNRTNLFT